MQKLLDGLLGEDSHDIIILLLLLGNQSILQRVVVPYVCHQVPFGATLHLEIRKMQNSSLLTKMPVILPYTAKMGNYILPSDLISIFNISIMTITYKTCTHK